MKQKKLMMMSFLTAMTFFLLVVPVVKAQVQVYFQPVELYRFVVSNNKLGYFLTPYYSEGVNNGYTYDGVTGFIYVPEFGFTPSNPGLRPLHQWRIITSGRVHYYYSQYYRTLNSDATYQGVRGYMYDPLANEVTVPRLVGPGTVTATLYKVKSCYSQSYGYWHGLLTPITGFPGYYSLESPPTSSYNCGDEHELVGGAIATNRGTRPGAGLRVSESNPGTQVPEDSPDSPAEIFNEPPPPPTCDPDQENTCYMNGGYWDQSNCSCYIPW